MSVASTSPTSGRPEPSSLSFPPLFSVCLILISSYGTAPLSGPDGLQIPYSHVSLLGLSMLVSMVACATPTLTETAHSLLVSLPV